MAGLRRVTNLIRRQNAARQIVNDWNREHHVGRVVRVRLVGGGTFDTVTRTEASIAADGYTPVLHVRGISGAYPLDRLEPRHTSDGTVDFTRASGDKVCEACGKLFFDHPDYFGYLGQHDIPFLHVLCDGRLVKL